MYVTVVLYVCVACSHSNLANVLSIAAATGDVTCAQDAFKLSSSPNAVCNSGTGMWTWTGVCRGKCIQSVSKTYRHI